MELERLKTKKKIHEYAKIQMLGNERKLSRLEFRVLEKCGERWRG
jgi:hypothetical protein